MPNLPFLSNSLSKNFHRSLHYAENFLTADLNKNETLDHEIDYARDLKMNKFFWGAASASHQVEGGTINNWSEWEKSDLRMQMLRSENKDSKNYVSGRATDHFNRYSEDFALAKELGHNATRISLEWSRIVPTEGEVDQQGIHHYIKVIEALKSKGLEPFITLWHWTIPVWLAEKGGMASSEFARHFEFYTKACLPILQGRVKYAMTMNEPEVCSSLGYIAGIHPPAFQRDMLGFWAAVRNMRKAHKLAYKVLKDFSRELRVGVATHQIYMETDNSFKSRFIAYFGNKFWNDLFIGSWIGYFDFLGVNYYFRKETYKKIERNVHTDSLLEHVEKREKEWNEKNRTHLSDFPGIDKIENAAPLSDMSWELYPWGIGECLKRLRKYNVPLIVTEFGLADMRDKYRAWYISEGVASVMDAKKSGVDVFGFLYWSLTDNFEWQDGFYPRFGLIEINYDTLERKIRPSALVYKKIIEENS